MFSNVYKEDIEQIISSPEIPWDTLADTTVLVTGATGLIGNALVHALSAAKERYFLNLRIIAYGRNAGKGKALSQGCGIEFIGDDIRKPFPIPFIGDNVNYIFHCAAVTRSAEMVAKPVDVITTAVDGTRNVFELARKVHSKSVVYLSSMEIYGQIALDEVYELNLGYLDLSNVRNSYPESKRMCESLSVSYWRQYGVPVKIARLAQTFGAGTPKDDPRIFAQLARSAIAGEDLILHTEGKSRGNYCYTADTIRALFLLLFEGQNGEAYNIANPDTSVKIREMAEILANEICGGRVSVVINIPDDIKKRGYAPDIGYKLNTDKIQNLGWKQRYGLADMYKRMIADWIGDCI